MPRKPVTPPTLPDPIPEKDLEQSTKRQYVRRTPEERLLQLEQAKSRILARQSRLHEKMEEAHAQILHTPASRKLRMQMQLKFQAATEHLVPDWDERHFIAAIANAMSDDPDTLKETGAVILDEKGGNRRGGPKKR